MIDSSSLFKAESFSLSQEAIEEFESLKASIEKGIVSAVNESIPFVVEINVSDVALAATLHQNNPSRK